MESLTFSEGANQLCRLMNASPSDAFKNAQPLVLLLPLLLTPVNTSNLRRLFWYARYANAFDGENPVIVIPKKTIQVLLLWWSPHAVDSAER